MAENLDQYEAYFQFSRKTYGRRRYILLKFYENGTFPKTRLLAKYSEQIGLLIVLSFWVSLPSCLCLDIIFNWELATHWSYCISIVGDLLSATT